LYRAHWTSIRFSGQHDDDIRRLGVVYDQRLPSIGSKN
jgi:hypothetical protein